MADALSRARASAALAGLVLAGAPAWAQPVTGVYVGAGAGYGFLQSQSVDSSASGAGHVRFGSGVAALGSVGYGLGNGLRVELEADWRRDWQSGGARGDGQENKAGVMVNALFDIDAGLGWVSPYVGLGGGYQWARWSGLSVAAFDASGTAGSLAYQAIVGAAAPIEAFPGLSVTLEYRFLGLPGGRNYAASGATRAQSSDDANHAVLLGLRYALAAPDNGPVAPPRLAVPPDAAIPSRTYLVFFDWDSAALSARARDIIAEAARNSARVEHTRLEVTGHADRTGTEDYNQALSLRRARAVADEVQRWGIPADQIDVRGVGDTQPLVNTAAGVREPQNRRVEIIYR